MRNCNGANRQRRVATIRYCASVGNPFQVDSGIKVLHGNLGEAVIKISAVKRGALAG